MRVEPVLGIEIKDKIISERNFKDFSIFSTAQMLEEYFTNYGYQFIDFSILGEDTILVKNRNLEFSQITLNYDHYQIINYKTKEVLVENLDASKVSEMKQNNYPVTILPIQYRIEKLEKDTLIDNYTSMTLLEADEIRFVTPDLLFVRLYGLEYLYDIFNKVGYPLLKEETNIYIGKTKEQFMDMRNRMYQIIQNTIKPIFIGEENIVELVRRYPYGKRTGTRFHLLNHPIYYGIEKVDGKESVFIWYQNKEDRDSILKEIGIEVESLLEKQKGQLKRD